MTWNIETLPSVVTIVARLNEVFPEGVEARTDVVGERAARTVFVFLYVRAVEGITTNRLRPNMVTLMTDAQSQHQEIVQREEWRQATLRPGAGKLGIEGRWYAENTREPIRDETIRSLVVHGAVVEDTTLATTSPTPRYQLARDFAMIFEPDLTGEPLEAAMDEWRRRHLGAAMQARIALVRQQALQQGGAAVHFPDGSVRTLAAGPSTPLAKAAVEEFAPRFLNTPVVLSVTESRKRVAYEDERMLALAKLTPDPRLMPDVVLADVGTSDSRLRLVFLELVATGGPNSATRVAEVREWLRGQGLSGALAAFGTVFSERGEAAFRRYIGDLAWGLSHGWRVSPTTSSFC